MVTEVLGALRTNSTGGHGGPPYETGRGVIHARAHYCRHTKKRARKLIPCSMQKRREIQLLILAATILAAALVAGAAIHLVIIEIAIPATLFTGLSSALLIIRFRPGVCLPKSSLSRPAEPISS